MAISATSRRLSFTLSSSQPVLIGIRVLDKILDRVLEQYKARLAQPYHIKKLQNHAAYNDIILGLGCRCWTCLGRANT